LRWLPFLVVGAALFVLALSSDVYELTSPSAFGYHVVLRKVYSIVAFAIVGVSYAFARPRSGVVETATAIALYSGLIEFGQWFTSDESLTWNLVDVACGFAGGMLGGALVSRVRAARAK
jgi:VanZ family protein